jgi:hypothetical protein
MLAVCAGACTSQTAVPDPVEPFHAGMVFASERRLLDAGPHLKRIVLDDQRDLWLRMKVPDMNRLELVSITFIRPGGHAFYETTVPYSSDPGMREMEMAGALHPIAVHPATRITGGYLLDHLIPISGTVFSRRPFPGLWLVRAVAAGQMLSAELEVEVRRPTP